MATVPVCSPTGKILQYLESDYAATLKGVRLIRARRRREVVRVELLPLSAHVRPTLSGDGSAFQQQLCDGHSCWALRGVRGSR